MENNTKIKSIQGVVVSNSNKNTVTVLVSRLKADPLYRKKYKVSKKYKAECLKDASIGDTVQIVQCRPLSKTKKYKVVE